jgi:squalene-hopene/tetraprenyl-beta-curcumene cyclase
MTLPPGRERLESAYHTALAALLAERQPDGHWTGELSTSALSTATAVSALALVQKHAAPPRPHDPLIAGGLAWLASHQNADGGWGDTDKSRSNISTTMLCRAAFHLTGAAEPYADCLRWAAAYLSERFGATAAAQAEAVRTRYGKDRTFAVPILTTCALAGLVAWREVPALPFELACLPQAWFRFLRLPVVSYALPALIAIGQTIHHHRPPWNPLTRFVRRRAVRKSLQVLEAIQPSSGGFLEATPLTSFVTLSLASVGLAEHPVARKGVEFLVTSVRSDGSWPIDSNLATWVTTLAVNALATSGALRHLGQQTELIAWLLNQQFKERHPYTGADRGGWGWTNLPGSVPDADDTSSTLLALRHLYPDSLPVLCAVDDGYLWLYGLQNRDGGWPTFCRGWGTLPFDRSGADLTAHALRALAAWERPPGKPSVSYTSPTTKSTREYVPPIFDWGSPFLHRGFDYLARHQRPDGSWLPLWFGNQYAPDDANPTYGTARVLAAYRDLDKMNDEPARRGIAWLLAAQNRDGGWGGAPAIPSSIEETALAVEVLLAAGPRAKTAVNNGLAWLVEQVEVGGLNHPTPIGFYFAKLWYYEKLYPIIFTVAALGLACKQLPGGTLPSPPAHHAGSP